LNELNKNNDLILDIFDPRIRLKGMIDLEAFIKEYDFAGCVVLLAGSREILPMEEEKLRKLGKLLAERSNHMTFRSGNADGADQFFTQGVGEVDKSRIEVFTPYATHKQGNRRGYNAFSLEEVDVVNEPTLVEQAKENKNTKYGVEQYVKGASKGKTVANGALILRSTLMVTGASNPFVQSANFAIFYVDKTSVKSGGTGHTIQVCKNLNVPHIDQDTWFSWLE
jgi:hypothetical protein